MGTILAFPAIAASRRPGSTIDGGPRESISSKVVSPKTTSPNVMGTVVILPVVRIEREPDTSGGRGPEEGAAASGRRRRRR